MSVVGRKGKDAFGAEVDGDWSTRRLFVGDSGRDISLGSTGKGMSSLKGGDMMLVVSWGRLRLVDVVGSGKENNGDEGSRKEENWEVSVIQASI